MNTGLLRHAVATVLTVYGIETERELIKRGKPAIAVATVLTVYGIETLVKLAMLDLLSLVATVLTVYGIETGSIFSWLPSSELMVLQQCLPFTVLKPTNTSDKSTTNKVATVLTVYGIETYGANPHSSPHSCNSAYRLRY